MEAVEIEWQPRRRKKRRWSIITHDEDKPIIKAMTWQEYKQWKSTKPKGMWE